MTDMTLLTTEELSELMARVDGDGKVSGFTGFELVLLISHLKQTQQLQFLSDWYNKLFDSMVQDGILREDGTIALSMFSLYWDTATMPIYHRTRTEPEE